MNSKTKRGKDRLTKAEVRAARRQRRNRRRRTLRTAAFSAVLVIALLFIVSLFAGSLPISFGGGQGGVGQRYPDHGGNLHIRQGESHPPYNSTPATSGWHYSESGLAPARWGIHSEVLPDEVLVHNLEHGGVAIHYNCPDGCDDLVTQLSEIARRSAKVILSPYPDIDTKIALTAWTYLDKFDEFDEDRILNFIRAHVNSPTAPEGFAR